MAYTALNPAAWAGIGSAFTEGQLGTKGLTLSVYDMPPYEEVRLRMENSEKIGFIEKLKLWGFSRGVDTPLIGHAQVPRIFNAIQFDLIVAAPTGAGTPMTVRIAPTSMFAPASTTVGGVQAYASPLRQYDEIMLPNRKIAWVKSKISTGTQHQFVLVPKDATVDLAAVITVGNLATVSYPIVGNSYPDGSNVGEGKTRRVRKYSNEFQIIKDQFRVTGGAKSLRLYHTNEMGTSGNVVGVHLDPVMKQTYDRNRSYALLTGEKQSNAEMTVANAILAQDTVGTGTEGFLPFVENEGHDMTTVFATYTLDDLRAIALKYNQSMVSTTDFAYMHSFAAKSAIDKTILSNFDNTADRYLKSIYETMIGTNDKFNFTSADDYALKIGFKSVKIDSYNFVFTSMHEFDDPAGLGALAYYQKYAIVAPMGFTTDVESQANMPMFGYQFRKQGSFSRESVTSTWGGHMATDGAVVNGDDIQHVAVGCHIAFHGYCGNHTVFQHE